MHASTRSTQRCRALPHTYLPVHTPGTHPRAAARGVTLLQRQSSVLSEHERAVLEVGRVPACTHVVPPTRVCHSSTLPLRGSDQA